MTGSMPVSIFKRCTFLALLAMAILSLSACATTQTHVRNGAAQNEEEGGKQSLAALEAAYKHNSDNPAAALGYAQSLREHGRLQRASIVLGPFMQDGKTRDPAMIAEYGSIQAAMGNYNEAEKYANRALALDQKNGQAWCVLGLALDARDKHDEAETAFRKALANWQGDQSPVLNYLGLNLAAQGFLDEAVETLRKAVSLAPHKTEIERNLRIVTAMQQQSPSHPKPVPVPPHKPAQG